MNKSKTANSTLPIIHYSLFIAIILLTWGLRLCYLETVPSGWRDDELINIHALSGELLAGNFPLYYTGASGHEPLYHHLHAGVHAVLGFNVLSGHLLSVAFGTLSIALTYALAHRLFGRATAIIASLALTMSFWSLMYSRTAIRHISLPPFALAIFYLLWRALAAKKSRATKTWFLLGCTVGLSIYTYPAARVLPGLLILFVIYLALFHREQFRRCWRGVLLSLVIAGVVVIPLGVAIAQGRSDAAAQGIGADARLAELAVPLRALQDGDILPLIKYTWTTLQMFHATGDSEWLYNIPDRPVFNLLGGLLLWAGVVLCVYRWRRPRYFFLLLWLGLGLLPAFVSTPPASLSHTILAQPAAYILPALTLTQIQSRITLPRKRSLLIVHSLLLILFLVTNAVRDLRDYFVVWPQRGMMRFLYRSDYRDAAVYLDAHPEITDIAIASDLMGPWNRLALEVDIQRDDISVRLFNPERALVWVEQDVPSLVLFTSFPDPAPQISELLTAHTDLPHFELYTVPELQVVNDELQIARFANGLDLLDTRWVDDEVLTTWRVSAPFDLPPLPIVANPPPPGVYPGPRLSVFAHLLASDGTFLAGDDGLWVDPLTLQSGDRFVQIHRLTLPSDASAGPYTLALGLYDPLTGDRWPTLQNDGQLGPDSVSISVEERP
ncbi:MAG: glycosyltransferase family 39 protein [Chloroflexi bacterium]|nr:glycosyltransferase family 39 protein [Chloroflexota bacterium]